MFVTVKYRLCTKFKKDALPKLADCEKPKLKPLCVAVVTVGWLSATSVHLCFIHASSFVKYKRPVCRNLVYHLFCTVMECGLMECKLQAFENKPPRKVFGLRRMK